MFMTGESPYDGTAQLLSFWSVILDASFRGGRGRRRTGRWLKEDQEDE